jgi:hypothetical protein
MKAERWVVKMALMMVDWRVERWVSTKAAV